MDRKEIRGVTRAKFAPLFLITAVMALLLGGCGDRKPKLVVGSKNFTEQVVLGEIVAQHLENRLGRKVERKLNLGGTLITYQALQGGHISVYPEYTGTIQSEILKETPGTEASVMLERVRAEMRRIAQTEVLDPLGIDNSFVMAIRSADAAKYKVATLSEAATAKDGWKLGVGYEFLTRSDGMPLLNKYHLPMSAAPRSMDLGLLFRALMDGQVTMVAANATDGPLASSDFTVLRDDQKVFPPYQACLLVRQDVIAAEPAVKAALMELSGKFTNEIMRKLDAQVDVEHRQPSEVAGKFLTQAGLK
jgi:glycine betaine/choline ABC-type transport system substrate-binding protein